MASKKSWSYYLNWCDNFGGMELTKGPQTFKYPRKPAQEKDPRATKTPPKTIFENKGLVAGKEIIGDYYKFSCEHHRPEEEEIIWNEEEISLYMAVSRFPAYYWPQRNLLALNTNRLVGVNVTGNLKRYHSNPLFSIEKLNVKMKELKESEYAIDLKLGWFNTRNVHERVQSEALFGSRIDKDEEYKRIEKLGGYLKSGRLVFLFENMQIVAQISNGVSIYFPERYPEDVELSFLMWLHDNYCYRAKKKLPGT